MAKGTSSSVRACAFKLRALILGIRTRADLFSQGILAMLSWACVENSSSGNCPSRDRWHDSSAVWLVELTGDSRICRGFPVSLCRGWYVRQWFRSRSMVQEFSCLTRRANRCWSKKQRTPSVGGAEWKHAWACPKVLWRVRTLDPGEYGSLVAMVRVGIAFVAFNHCE